MEYILEITSVTFFMAKGPEKYMLDDTTFHTRVAAIHELPNGLEVHFENGNVFKRIGVPYELTSKKISK